MKIKIMKSVLSVAILAAMTSGVLAAGTTAGTDVDNRASIAYSVGGINQTAINSSEGGNSDPTACTGATECQTSFVVDKKVDLTVTATAGNTPIVPSGTSDHTFTLANTGNDIEYFSLSSVINDATDTFDPTNCTQTVVASSVTGSYLDPTTNTTVNSTSSPLYLAPDDTATITVSCTAPALLNPTTPLINGNTAKVSLVATAIQTAGGTAHTDSPTDTVGKDTVLADGTGSVDALRDAKHSAITTYIIATADLKVKKAPPIVTAMPAGAGAALFHIPGATIQYTIEVSNADGAEAARSLIISDTLPPEYDPATITCSVSGPAVVNTVYPIAVSGTPLAPGCTISGSTVTTGSFTLPGGVGSINTETLTITAKIL